MDPDSERLVLAEGVFLCVVERHAVMLDLKTDTYSAVPLGEDLGDESVSDEELERRLLIQLQPHRSTLLDAGVLVSGIAGGARVSVYRALVSPARHFLGRDDARCFGLTGDMTRSLRIGFRDVVRFVLASFRASRLLKTRPIGEVVGAVRVRKARRHAEVARIDDLRRQVMIFRRLRPLYPRPYLCLFDALALVEFLARSGHFPTWVFGVQLEPFGAHCWVQIDDRVLNEETEYAREFTPIMAV